MENSAFCCNSVSKTAGINTDYEGYSKINLRLVGKNKRVVIASKRTFSSNKELLFLLYAYPHTFSPRSVGVNTDRTKRGRALSFCVKKTNHSTYGTSQLAGAAMTVSMFYQYLLLHYAAKMY